MLTTLDRAHSEAHLSLLGIDLDKILVGCAEGSEPEPYFNDLSSSMITKQLQALDKEQVKELFEDSKATL